MPVLAGSCHCGAHRVELATSREPQDFEVRACQCSFCRKQGALSISDPGGQLTYRVTPAFLTVYRFGLRLADFLVCSRCGAYLGAWMTENARGLGVLNMNVLEARDRFGAAQAMDYAGESAQQRLARRRERWTPARLVEVVSA